jgi:DNA polymerase
MTAEQKTLLASFLDLTADTLRGGYTRERTPHSFTDDIAPVSLQESQSSVEDVSSSQAARPLVMLIGEGLESSGEAGQLLDKMLASIGLFRGGNCVTGREDQINTLRPRFILCLGSGRELAYTGEGYQCDDGGVIPLLATYHPDELLRNRDLKRPAWEDLKSLRARLAELDPGYERSVKEG